MNNFRYRLAKFFQGRTGIDALGRTCTWGALLFMVLTMITNWAIFYFIAMVLLIYSFIRMFSKNYQKRYYENQKFLQKTAKIRGFFKNFGFNIKKYFSKLKYDRQQRKIYAIFYCPNCKQKLRVPKGRGTIQVTCNRCKQQFYKKV